MKLSVIIPTLEEADNISQLLPILKQGLLGLPHEILVIDAGSRDRTLEKAQEFGADIVRVSPMRGRAAQMNYGASIASGDVLYFVHADTRPPITFWQDIEDSLAHGYDAGCYRSSYDTNIWLMKFNAWLTRFNLLFLRGGDQSLFIRKAVFDRLEGYREDYHIMEDFEFLRRLRQAVPFRIVPKNILISARKYDQNSYLRVNYANITVVSKYRRGASQEDLVSTYKRLLQDR